MTRKELSDKWWYRLIKVIYILVVIFVIVTIAGVGIAISGESAPKKVISTTNSYVTCLDSHKLYSLDSLGIYKFEAEYGVLSNSAETKISKVCHNPNDPFDILHHYTFTKEYDTYGGWSQVIDGLCVTLAVIIIAAIILRIASASFFYIATGSFDGFGVKRKTQDSVNDIKK